MAVHPYESFKEWERDMDRIRAHPQDMHLIQYVKGRVNASPEEIKKQVHEYLQDVAFERNPVDAGERLAKQTGKWLFIKTRHDPWFSA